MRLADVLPRAERVAQPLQPGCLLSCAGRPLGRFLPLLGGALGFFPLLDGAAFGFSLPSLSLGLDLRVLRGCVPQGCDDKRERNAANKEHEEEEEVAHGGEV